MSDIQRHEFDWLQEQLHQQRAHIEDLMYNKELLQQAIELLTAEVNLIKNEGCWRYFQGSCLNHKDKDE